VTTDNTRGLPVIGAVLLGGASRRFGTDKALADADGQPMGGVVVAALRDGGCDPVVGVGGLAGATLAIPTVADRYPGEGPLAALATVLLWARSGLVVVAACDLPRLQASHVRSLVEVAVPGLGGRASIAKVDGEAQPSLACWPAAAGVRLADAVRNGERAWRSAIKIVDHVLVEMPPDSTADADTPAELARLMQFWPDVGGDTH